MELNEVREVTGQKEMVDGLLGGEVEVDYETGHIAGAGSHMRKRARLGHLADAASSWSVTALSEQVAAATVAADPAVLHLDVQLLQDMVVLCLATAVGGLLAAAADLPHTLGYILGGMLVGPSCLDFVERVVQTETLAQFGSIFMLFGHGLVYSQVKPCLPEARQGRLLMSVGLFAWPPGCSLAGRRRVVRRSRRNPALTQS